MDHMETRKAIRQEQFLKINDIFRNSQYPQEIFCQANCVQPHFLNTSYIQQLTKPCCKILKIGIFWDTQPW